MKVGQRLASALVKLVVEEKVDIATAADAALAILKKSSPSEIGAFPKLVAKELRRSKILRVRVTTPSGTSSLDIHAFSKAAHGRVIDLVQAKEESMIGGAILQAGDERLDMSLKTALEQLFSELLEPLSV